MRSLVTLSLLVCTLALAQAPTPRLVEDWRHAYRGEDATGPHVIALWQFEPGAELKDASGKGHDLTLRGARSSAEGRFGGGLESFRGWPDKDESHCAVAANDRALSPTGAFTIELWLCPKPELEGCATAFLLDKMYGDKTDYQLVLTGTEKNPLKRLRANLGFGDAVVSFTSDPARYEPGVWRHVAFTYDGDGTAHFYRDGVCLGGRTEPGRSAISPGKLPLALGDRGGSLYRGFPGVLDQIRLCNGVMTFGPVAMACVSDRRAFVRMERAALRFSVTNLQRTALTGAEVVFSVAGREAAKLPVPDLAPGASHVAETRLDTSLRPQAYEVSARVTIPGGATDEERFRVTIAPRPLPQRFPVMMWGGASVKDCARLKDLGFTHFMGLNADYGKIWDAGKPTEASAPQTVASTKAALDDALAAGLGILGYLYPGRWAQCKPEFQRVNEQGQPYPKPTDVCGLFPEIKQYCANVGASVAQTYGAFPALQWVDVHSEVRDGSRPCFHTHDRAAFKQFAGFDMPAFPAPVVHLRGIPYASIQDFPASHIIPDNYPLYLYYQWLWKQGDGWNDLHTAVDQGLKSTGRQDLMTFYAPAVRAASVWGSGGHVDQIGQWSYSYPDPIRVGMDVDECFAMAAGADRPGQVQSAVQLIWYRSQTAPPPGEAATAQTAQFMDKDTPGARGEDEGGPAVAEWEREQPDARFITIAPMHLREAVWTKLARPIQAMQHHGWQSLVDTGLKDAYRYTNPDTQDELQRLARTVYEPLQPALMQVPDRPTDVAFLESFAAQMFAQRGTFGWNGGWEGDAYLVLQYAQLQPQVIYDETVMKRGLDGYKVLVLTDCDVLTEGVVQRIKAFQARGGLIIADERLVGAIAPDIRLRSFTRPNKADEAKALLLKTAAALRAELDAHYQRYAASGSPEVVTRCRRYATTDYLFAINDRREFGDYVGRHGLVMENGLPSEATLTLRRPGGAVYDLVAHRPVTATAAKGALSFPAALGPCEGRVYMVTDRPLAALRLTAPATVARGTAARCRVAVLDDRGQPLAAVVPLRVDFLDPAGRPAEFSGFYGAKDGQVEISFDLASNDTPGVWRLQVTELASGREADAYVRVSAGKP